MKVQERALLIWKDKCTTLHDVWIFKFSCTNYSKIKHDRFKLASWLQENPLPTSTQNNFKVVVAKLALTRITLLAGGGVDFKNPFTCQWSVASPLLFPEIWAQIQAGSLSQIQIENWVFMNNTSMWYSSKYCNPAMGDPCSWW